MAEAFGHRWTSSFGVDASKGAGATWAKGLGGLTIEQIARGTEVALIDSEDGWPPTLSEFRAMCVGIPSFAEACGAHKDARDGFSALMWQYVDFYRYRLADAEKAERMLRDAYAAARKHLMHGGSLPEIHVELAAPETSHEHRTAASDETVAESMARIHHALYGANTTPPVQGNAKHGVEERRAA
jgi:hypothetical protein